MTASRRQPRRNPEPRTVEHVALSHGLVAVLVGRLPTDPPRPRITWSTDVGAARARRRTSATRDTAS